MFHKTLFITIILCIVGVAIGFHYFSETSGLLNRYQKLGLVQSDLKYEKVERSWGDQGLIFYQVQFPFINTPIKADKMSLSLEDSGISMKLKNARIKVIEGLKKAYNSDVSEKLNTYVPYKDFINRLLTTMAVMGIDDFLGDIAINTVYSDAKTMKFNIQMAQENQPTIQMEGIIHVPIIGAHQLSDLWNGEVESVQVKVKESLFNRYINYAKSRNFSLPSSIQNGILKMKGKVGNTLPSLKQILK